MVLEDARQKLTRRQLRDEWSADFPKPSEHALWRWLDDGLAKGLVCRDGARRRNEPFRYWLPGMPEKWRNDPLVPPGLGDLFRGFHVPSG